jgi:hypothetical protein
LGVGSRSQAAVDIFQRAADLGGHLIVAFIAPVGASRQASADRPVGSATTLDAKSAAALARRLIDQAMRHWSATPGGPKASSTTSPKPEASKARAYQEPGKSSGGR